MSKILVELTGEQLDIEDMQFALKTSSWRIVNEENSFYIRSKNIDTIKDDQEIISKCTEVLNILKRSSPGSDDEFFIRQLKTSYHFHNVMHLQGLYVLLYISLCNLQYGKE